MNMMRYDDGGGEKEPTNDNIEQQDGYRILVEFAVRHLDFQWAELESVLDMYNITVLQQDEQQQQEEEENGTTTTEEKEQQETNHRRTKNQTTAATATKLSSSKMKRKLYCRKLALPTHNYNNDEEKAQPQQRRPFALLALPWDSPLIPVTTTSRRKSATCIKQKNDDEDVERQKTSENDNDPAAAGNDDNDITDDIATIILSHCTLVRRVIEIWGMSSISLLACAQQTRQFGECHGQGQRLVHEYMNNKHNTQQQQQQDDDEQPKGRSWKCTIWTLGTKFTREEQESMRQQFSFLKFVGPVQMIEPDEEFLLIREVELDAHGGAVYPRHDHQKQLIVENDIRPPLACYFGRCLRNRRKSTTTKTTDGDDDDNRTKNNEDVEDDDKNTTKKKKKKRKKEKRLDGNLEMYSLKQRKYLGPTSMDAELSFVMTNFGQVQSGKSLVFDPFVGTGSILLSCALRGAALCVGTDIDIRVLRGKCSDENIFANFRQYQLPRPELIRSDNHMYHRHFVHIENLYDAIVCDPPYGIRAGARQSGSRRRSKDDEKEVVIKVLPEHRHDHIAQTQPYPVADVMADLLDVAARTLRMGGRLVFVIPSFAQDFDPDNDLPRHVCLKRLYVCYQPFTAELGRRIVVMKKIQSYDPKLRAAYVANAWKNGPASAEKCVDIREKIQEAAKKKPNYEEKAAIRKEKRRKHREAKKEAKRRAKMTGMEQGDAEQPYQSDGGKNP